MCSAIMDLGTPKHYLVWLFFWYSTSFHDSNTHGPSGFAFRILSCLRPVRPSLAGGVPLI